jgi:hypothetical protein
MNSGIHITERLQKSYTAVITQFISQGCRGQTGKRFVQSHDKVLVGPVFPVVRFSGRVGQIPVHGIQVCGDQQGSGIVSQVF